MYDVICMHDCLKQIHGKTFNFVSPGRADQPFGYTIKEMLEMNPYFHFDFVDHSYQHYFFIYILM